VSFPQTFFGKEGLNMLKLEAVLNMMLKQKHVFCLKPGPLSTHALRSSLLELKAL